MEDDQNGWRARLKVKAGLELVGNNWVKVNLDGTFFWHTNVPTIVNPDVGPGGNGQDLRDPARIDHNSIIGAGAMVTFTVPLN